MSGVHRAIAVLNEPDKLLEKIQLFDTIATKMTGNVNFQNNANQVSDFAKEVALLKTLQGVAANRSKGSAKARNDQLAVVVKGAHGLKAIVQVAADSDPDHAETIIQSAGMSVRMVSIRQKQTLEAQQGELSGQAKLIAPVVEGTFSYQWAWSTDQKVWTNIPLAMVSITTADGLTPGTTYWFRFQYLTKKGWSDWSKSTSLFVK